MSRKKEAVDWGMKDIRALRDKWSEMPWDEFMAEQDRLYASALRRIARIRRKRALEQNAEKVGNAGKSKKKALRPVKPRAKAHA